ncbi:Nucleotidyltransferase [Sporormia fimetaria CBS 119925]|uniref:DNA-directed DNA polymerase n=1 Tax=Sporormia fimetaria CBS 119925 TaxID=1340428 RepID=A0A6A6VKK5_9PLEO|nr:Nucleotidyltransferase [Sporormia fimetaria CBS 119925]
MEDIDSSQASSIDTVPKPPDLSSIPPIVVVSAHFQNDEKQELERKLRRHGAPLTEDVSKAKVFIGKVGTKRRAEFELRSRKFTVEEVVEGAVIRSPPRDDGPPSKRRKVEGSLAKPIVVDEEGSVTEEEPETEEKNDSETEDELPSAIEDARSPSPDTAETVAALARAVFGSEDGNDTIWFIKTDWLDRCISIGHILPLADDLVYKGRVLERPPAPSSTPRSDTPFFSSPASRHTSIPASRTTSAAPPTPTRSILERAKLDAATAPAPSRYIPNQHPSHGSRRFETSSFASSALKASQITHQTAHLLQQTTSEYEGTDSDIPEPPEWVKKGIKYSCQRFTPPNPPNAPFIEELKKIRTARILIDDEIGVRAYSTIIAAIAAYPYPFTSPREILRLPGCEAKVANLWVEWKNTGSIQAVAEYEADDAMKVLRTFYDIWGVGAKTARNFYYNHHWTDLDDVIEYGWNDLDRVQQIGLKYYDEFLDGIPRSEVESIADVVRRQGVKLRDDRITVTVVGGYRRGKELSGDVDMIVSHPELASTAGLVQELVESLEEEGWITHTLLLSLNNTNRGQHTLPFRTSKQAGVGFDTLDKALVVWQDPHWPMEPQDRAENPNAKNPNIHRRVDIIVSPWRTVGCAIMGWSGGTTFQRDLRRYAKYYKGWKFDSSGIRSRETGEVVMLEGPEGVEGTPEEAERRVFEGLGLEFVPPGMRCTN